MDSRIEAYMKQIPVLAEAATREEVFQVSSRECPESRQGEKAVSKERIQDAARRLERSAPYLAEVFPETAARNGIIESELWEIGVIRQELNQEWGAGITGRLFLRVDSHLPIFGSVKVRGGVYEALKHAGGLAFKTGLPNESEDYRKLSTSEIREFFSRYKVQVGPIGNLGLSVGIMSAKLGFQVTVYMSVSARQQKKNLLRSRGVTVIECESNYCAAVEERRKSSDQDPMSYFVGDENSVNLFFGYAVAGQWLKRQLEERGIQVDRRHPLFAYLPYRIGGASGGVAYGLEEIYGDCVHCFFMEPTRTCCMLIGMATGGYGKACVRNLGISGKADADGLIVRRPSAFVGRVVEKRPAGIHTVEDGRPYELMRMLMKTEDIFIEPSARASLVASLRAGKTDDYIREKGLSGCMERAVHIAWTTGGNMVPPEMMAEYLNTQVQSANL